MNNATTTREEQRRSFILEAPPMRVILSVGLPLVFYNGISQGFSFFDTLIASNIGAKTVSTVAYISQIGQMFQAIGSGLGIGGGILIARAFGAGDKKGVERYVSTVVFLALAIAAVLLAAMIPFPSAFLRLLGMPAELLTTETIAYFLVEIAGIAAVFVNTIYFAILRSKGSTRRIFWLNLMILSLKLGLTLAFVYVFRKGMVWLSIASLIAQASMTVIALATFLTPGNPFRVSLKAADFSPRTLAPVLALSLPVFLEKFAFNLGKVLVNSMAAAYGSLAIGALGISNRLGGLSTMPPIGFEDAEAAIIAQNLGNGNQRRAIAVFKRVLLLNLGIGLVMFVLMSVFRDPVISLFARGDPVFTAEIARIYNWERYATVLLAVSATVLGLLYGFGLTRVTMVLNSIRLFAFRIPPLWFILHYTSMDSEGLGVAMMVSNLMAGAVAGGVAFAFLGRLRSGTGTKNKDAAHTGEPVVSDK